MRHERPREQPRPVKHSRRAGGLTVVEVLVALVIVGVGLLGMAGTAALSLRTATAASRELRALREVERRLAVMSASGCEGLSSGEDGGGGDTPRISWTVAEVRRGARAIEAVARWADGSGARTLRLRSALLC
jgi:type II secretory pathway pseudopilin PulG